MHAHSRGSYAENALYLAGGYGEGGGCRRGKQGVFDTSVEHFGPTLGLSGQLLDHLVPVRNICGIGLEGWLGRIHRAHCVEHMLNKGVVRGLHVMKAGGGL